MKTYKTYHIYYLNPNIPGDTLKPLSIIVKARSEDEADKKAAKKLRSTGMIFKCELAE